MSNASSSATTFALEPWGEVYDVAPGRELSIVIDSPSPPTIEVALVGDDASHRMVAIHGPVDAGADVFDESGALIRGR